MYNDVEESILLIRSGVVLIGERMRMWGWLLYINK